MDPATWIAFTAASIVLLIIPGPTVLLVVSYALTQGCSDNDEDFYEVGVWRSPWRPAWRSATSRR